MRNQNVDWDESYDYSPNELDELSINNPRLYKEVVASNKKVLICNNCKDIWIEPKDRCDCGSTTLTETHESNKVYARNYA